VLVLVPEPELVLVLVLVLVPAPELVQPWHSLRILQIRFRLRPL